MRISDWSSDVCSSDLIAAQRLCRVLEADGLAGAGHLAVNVEPMLFMPRHQRSHALSHRVAEAGMAREGGIGFDEAIVDRLPRIVEDHLYDAEARLDRIEQGSIFLRAAMQFLQPCAGVILPAAAARSDEHTSELQSIMRTS